MAPPTLLSLLSLASLSAAHFHLNYPEWRADSLTTKTASQWIYPCANISETTDLANRTQWPTTGGSLNLSVSHPWALTYVNLGIGTNISSFNISLVSDFNQTGNGTFCLPETGKAALAAGLVASNLTAQDLDGMMGSLQVVQISHSGASLYNCADITFNASAALLSTDQCQNSTNVGGVAIENAMDMTTTTTTGGTASPTGAAGVLKPGMGALVAVGVAAWALL